MSVYASPGRHRRWPPVSVWLIASGLVVAVLVAVGAGVLIGRSAKSAAPMPGLASQRVVAAVDDSLSAINRGDFDAFAATVARDAVFEDFGGVRMQRGREEIVAVTEGYYNLGARYYRVGPVIQRGNLAAYPISCPPCPGGWSGIDLIQFDENLQIVHLWTGLGSA